ncbi:hypothetical protein [Candidatus Poriferisocius sp.]|uniref:hypothetical protein n=1 Tax=Candidatus Poriferisocius sp. TaxID=3101276 RepID=UPI003B014DE3
MGASSGSAGRLVLLGLVLALVLALLMVMAGPVMAQDRSGGSAPVAQAGEPDSQPTPLPGMSDDSRVTPSPGMSDDSRVTPSPGNSDEEVRVVLALLIAVAAVALLGTLIYWVRTGDGARGKGRDLPNTP